ncbi:AarF/UbiB family protein [Nocardioides sp. 616]|uniref:ABC1 kinase family protein n=1 Tax=Nocardioides sp. 616 TaxID=2268090 RepID=UPI000CE533C4|nr:AarF/UbiB family protein [Nocardioides sp. 616]
MTSTAKAPESTDSPLRRYARIARLAYRHGRGDLLQGLEMDEFSHDDDPPLGDDDKAEAFARDLEKMGPTYIKLGQLLSTRFDLLPVAYTQALARLQDDVTPFGFEAVREIVEAELGGRLEDLYGDFDPEPMAAASLGQVHRATLRNGREVVVKVQRPEARDVARADMDTLASLAAMIDRRTDVGRRYGFEKLVAQFRQSLAGELDYRREARNLQRFGKLVEPYDLLLVPQPVPALSTGRVLTMDLVEGRKVTELGKLALLDLDSAPVAEQLFACYLHLMLGEGVLHADPHPGNLLLTDDGRLALLDLGMVVSVPPRLQDKVVKLLLAITDGDGEEVAAVLAEMGHQLPDYDAGAFRNDVAHLVSEAVGAGPDLQAGMVLVELSRLSGLHGLRPPAEMSLIGKALLNLDSSTLHLDPGFSPAEALRDNVSAILASGLGVSPGGIMAAAIEAKEFAKLLPRRANRILDNLAAGEFNVRVDALDEERLHTVLLRVANRITLGMVIAAMLVGAALMMRVDEGPRLFGVPGVALSFFTLAVLAGVALTVWIVTTDGKVAARPRSRPGEHG